MDIYDGHSETGKGPLFFLGAGRSEKRFTTTCSFLTSALCLHVRSVYCKSREMAVTTVASAAKGLKKNKNKNGINRRLY